MVLYEVYHCSFLLWKCFHILNAKAAIRRLNILVKKDNGVLENLNEICLLVECLFQRLRFPVRHRKMFHNISALLLKVLELSNGDLSAGKKILQVLILLLKYEEKRACNLESDNSCALAIHRLGKEELLTRVFKLHKADEDVRDHEREIRKSLILVNARVSLSEINKVRRAVDLGITTEVYQKAQSSANPAHRMQSIVPIHSKDHHVCDGASDISLVITHTQKHLKRSDILTAGLKVVAKYIENAKGDILIDPFFSKAFILIINTALVSEKISQQQLAITIVLALTSKDRFCRFFGKNQGCEQLLKVLRNEGTQALAEKLHQIALWTISNLCKEGKHFTLLYLSNTSMVECLNLSLLNDFFRNIPCTTHT